MSQALSKTSDGEAATETQGSIATQPESHDIDMVDAEHRRTDHERIAEEVARVPAPSLYKFSADGEL